MDAARQKRLLEVANIAARVEKDTQVPAESVIAQWAVESKWGAAPCGKANYFGIKRASRHLKFCIVTTMEWYTDVQIAAWDRRHPDHTAKLTGKTLADGKFEVQLDDEFADYSSLEASVRDYAWLVSNGTPYKKAWSGFLESKEISGFIEGVAKAYSTSDAYSALVTTIAKQGNVTWSIQQARASLSTAA